MVSGYLDKMKRSESTIALPVVKEILGNNATSTELQRGITFRQFAKYVCSKKDKELNSHWRSQSAFIQLEYDFVATLENIEEDFIKIQQKTHCTTALPKVGQQSLANEGEHPNASDVPMFQINKLTTKPNYMDFYTPDLKEMVQDRYKDDVRFYNFVAGL